MYDILIKIGSWPIVISFALLEITKMIKCSAVHIAQRLLFCCERDVQQWPCLERDLP